MRKVLPLVLLLSTFIACTSDAPKQKSQPSEPFIVVGSAVDPATNSLIISIRPDPPFTEDAAKRAPEIVIEQNKARFKNITVKSFATSSLPYVTSVFDGNKVTHQMNAQAAPQKIPSH